jgi:hypothetical protein
MPNPPGDDAKAVLAEHLRIHLEHVTSLGARPRGTVFCQLPSAVTSSVDHPLLGSPSSLEGSDGMDMSSIEPWCPRPRLLSHVQVEAKQVFKVSACRTPNVGYPPLR